MDGQNDSKVIFWAFSAIKNITINMHIRILNVINVFDVPTCPVDSPVVGHYYIMGPLVLTWRNCCKQIPTILEDIKVYKTM